MNEFVTKDGIVLAIKKDLHQGDKKGCVIITHGICEHLGRYDYVSSFLAKAGYDVYRYDLRGHGNSTGVRGDVKDFRFFISDLHEIVCKINEKKMFLLGHSMGGFIVDAFSATYPNMVAGIISSAAPVIDLKMTKALRILPYRLFGFINKKNSLTELICTVPIVRQKYIDDPLVLKSTKIRLLGNVFVQGARYMRKNVNRIVAPILIIHGEQDGIVEKESSEWLYENIQSKDKKINIYKDLFHEILNEDIKDEILTTIVEWLNCH